MFCWRMKISKHIHSCLLVEEQGKAVLIDPGSYTLQETALNIEDLKQLDAVLITHEHADHVSLELLRRIMEKFPDIAILTNKQVAAKLAREHIEVFKKEEPSFIKKQNAPHEKILGAIPENTLFHVFGKLTHPGDSFQFAKTKEILALPIQAPWGSMVQAVEKAVEIKPKLVIPIHDWHLRDEARKHFYDAAENYLRNRGIEFRGLEVGETLEC